MKKEILDLQIAEATSPWEGFVLLKAEPTEGALPECRPGQFAQLRTGGALLRRPISIHNVEEGGRRVWFLVQAVGRGTRWFQTLKAGDCLNAVMPLGNGFGMPGSGDRVLLVGGGVGVAPLLFQGQRLRERGIPFAFLLGARSADLLLQLEEFRRVGEVFVATEDGSAGECGLVTQHSAFAAPYTLVQTCGPTPMMRAVARLAHEQGMRCEVSLENRMACGVGACLCCVTEDRTGHNRCVCTDGPVFGAEELNWD
ncbi:MAG: dihydroorotate dehydrogenase electron transfer subunit [Bacteroidaceae bacterium]|nr:dihydroorotate dehydrogenase electron transfer subunit [Bacteroidaceae bacterium]